MFIAKNPLIYVLFLIIFLSTYFFLIKTETLPESLIIETLKHNSPNLSYWGKPYPPVIFLLNLLYKKLPYNVAWNIQKIIYIIIILLIGISFNSLIRTLRILPYNSILPLYIVALTFVILPVNFISISTLLATLTFATSILIWNYYFSSRHPLWIFYLGLNTGLAIISNYFFIIYTITLITTTTIIGLFPKNRIKLLLNGITSIILPFIIIIILNDEFNNFFTFSLSYYFYEIKELSFQVNKYESILYTALLIITIISIIRTRSKILSYKINFRYTENIIFISMLISLTIFIIYKEMLSITILLLVSLFYLIILIAETQKRIYKLFYFLFFTLLISYFSVKNYKYPPSYKEKIKYTSKFIEKNKTLCYLGKNNKLLIFENYKTSVPMEYYELFKWHLKLNNKKLDSYYLKFIIKKFPHYIIIEKGEPDIVQILPILEFFYGNKVYTKDGNKIYYLTRNI